MHFGNATHQMHFCIKCIFAPTKCKGSIFVFCKAKNTAFLHQQNVMLCFAKMYLMQKCIFAKQSKASNTFVTFCFAEHFPLENVMLNILLRKMYAEHFPLENVRQNAFCRFLTFWFAKMHFCKQNVRVASLFFAKQKTSIFASNAFVTFCVTKCTHQMHFCIKCI